MFYAFTMLTTGVTDIYQLLSPGTIRVGMEARDKTEVINRLVDLLSESPAVKDIDAIRSAVLEREKVMSTGVGKGLALPHAKTSAIEDTAAAFVILKEPIDFGSIDNKPVQLVFLLVGTEAAKSLHIKLLSRISRLMNRDSFRERLLEADTPEQVLTIFKEGESELLEH